MTGVQTCALPIFGPAAGTEAIGLQRPKQVLQIDVAKTRNYTEVLDMLDENPYALPVFKIATQPGVAIARDFKGYDAPDTDLRNVGPAEMGLRSLSGRF